MESSFAEKIENMVKDLPDPESARRFFDQFSAKHPSQTNRLLRNDGLLSDILAIAAFSPLLSTTLLQNPEYLWWLNRHRSEPKVRSKEELLESLARFSMTNSETPPQVLLARFRRRELMRIFLHDLRRLVTIAETTEEISNLADAVLEYALRLTRQEMDNRFGAPLQTDEKGRMKPAGFCIVSFGKLGSKELNYSSDIDLLFVYSSDGSTSGQGSRGAVTNREYFVKLSEFIVKLVGEQTGEGAAYRVDLRLRPHGRVGALALSLNDTVRYYRTEARDWERQVLIRSRASAGDSEIFREFYAQVESYVFSAEETVFEALRNVRLSKEKINLENQSNRGFNVKLGHGGIREIEFIAQALQLAHGGQDVWLRAPHTLISLSRLADRRLLSENELTELYDAYDYLRQLEHLLQMEQGLQTHTVPEEPNRRLLVARRMGFADTSALDTETARQAGNVNRIFRRVFGPAANTDAAPAPHDGYSERRHQWITADALNAKVPGDGPASSPGVRQVLWSLEKSGHRADLTAGQLEAIEALARYAPPYAELLASNPALVAAIEVPEDVFGESDYITHLMRHVGEAPDFSGRLAAMRRAWSKSILEIVIADVFGRISQTESKKLQTELAEASIAAGLAIVQDEMFNRHAFERSRFSMAVLGLGKLGGRGVDYGSDLDLVLVYDDGVPSPAESLTHAQFYNRVVEIFVTTLSSLTREGHLYRVDLRLRPDGKNGQTSIGCQAFLDYLENRSAIWEWLAYVKLRAAGGDGLLGRKVEDEARRIIHRNALDKAASGLAAETRRIRERLEQEKARGRGTPQVDIKYGAGGLLDVYFAMRFLQLRHGLADDEENRSTDFMLEKLRENSLMSEEDFRSFREGYHFLSALDHNLRLAIGRSTRLPVANATALAAITDRMGLASVADLHEQLTIHRLNIRAAFDNVVR